MTDACGMKPAAIAAIGGCDRIIWPTKQIMMMIISATMKASTLRNPRRSSARMTKTSSAVSTTPQTSGRPNSSWSAIAVPITSARSQATIAISANSHSEIRVAGPY